MFYTTIKKHIDEMIDEISAGREECHQMILFNLIRNQNIPININAKLIYPLKQIKFSLHCPFLLIYPDISFEEIYRQGIEEDYFNLLKLISKFATLVDMLKDWVQKEVPNMIKWGEGVIFDKNGRTTKIPYSFFQR